MREAIESGAAFSAAAVSDRRRKLPIAPGGAKMASRILPRRMTLSPFWPQVGLKMAQVASKLPLTCHLASDVAGKLPQDASEEGFRPSRCHLGLILAPSWEPEWQFCVGGVAFFSISPFLS